MFGAADRHTRPEKKSVRAVVASEERERGVPQLLVLPRAPRETDLRAATAQSAVRM